MIFNSVKQSLWMIFTSLLLFILTFMAINYHGVNAILYIIYMIALTIVLLLFYFSFISKKRVEIVLGLNNRLLNLITYIYVAIYVLFLLIIVFFFSGAFAYKAKFFLDENFNWNEYLAYRPKCFESLELWNIDHLSSIDITLNSLNYVLLVIGFIFTIVHVYIVRKQFIELKNENNNFLIQVLQNNKIDFLKSALYYSFDCLILAISLFYMPVVIDSFKGALKSDLENIGIVIILILVLSTGAFFKIFMGIKYKLMNSRDFCIYFPISIFTFIYSLLFNIFCNFNYENMLTNYNFNKTFLYVIYYLIMGIAIFLIIHFYSREYNGQHLKRRN